MRGKQDGADEKPYIGIEHLAKTAEMASWRRVYLGMWITAFDASGKENDPKTPCFVVAGFIAPADAWIEFEPEWKRRLGPLDYWSTAHMHKTRPEILRSLVEMIPKYGIRKFSCSINLADLKSVPDDIRSNFLMHAYPLCARMLATYVELWALKERPVPIPTNRIEHVFEEGDVPQDALVHLMLEGGYKRPGFRYNRDCVIRGKPHTGFTPLQAADILSWHLYQIQKGFITNPTKDKDEIVRRCRLPFEELENMEETPRTITESDLEYYISTRTYIETRRQMMNAQGDAPFDFQEL